MAVKLSRWLSRLALVAGTVVLLALPVVPAMAGEYAALDGVKGIDSVFDFSLGKPAVAALVIPAIMDVYQNKDVLALYAPPRTVVVFHGMAVKLISTDRTGVAKEDLAAYDKVADQIRQLKKDGVKLEVCEYALKVMKVDPATIMPEIDKVGNGFISVLGYQAKGYSVVAIP